MLLGMQWFVFTGNQGEGALTTGSADWGGHSKGRSAWLATTNGPRSLLEISVTAELLADNGAGGGGGHEQGRQPSGAVLPVQVIRAARWDSTYTLPDVRAGVEDGGSLVLPGGPWRFRCPRHSARWLSFVPGGVRSYGRGRGGRNPGVDHQSPMSRTKKPSNLHRFAATTAVRAVATLPVRNTAGVVRGTVRLHEWNRRLSSSSQFAPGECGKYLPTYAPFPTAAANPDLPRPD